MASEAIRLGPFTGGLNTASDETSIQDTDLTISENFELDLDGSLTTRPPIVRVLNTFPAGFANIHLLGYYVSTTGAKYLIASNSVSATYYYNGTSWILITNALAAAAIVQYRDKLWMTAAPNTSQSGGSWDPTAGFTVVSDMPKGRTIAVNKERLWIGGGVDAVTNGARLYYSGVAAPTEWPPNVNAGFINISAGDGQNIVEIVIYFTDILIFKEHSVYRFSFSAAPEGGEVTRLSATIGVAAQGCVAVYENTTYVLYSDKVYELVNYNFNLISTKLPLVGGNPVGIRRPFGLGAWADRLVVTYYDRVYVYGLRTGTWSEWTTYFGAPARLVPTPASQGEPAEAYMTNNRDGIPGLYRIRDEITTDTENFTAKMRTKYYDYQSSHAFKRLMWWGADLIARGNVTGIAMPIVFNVSTTHGQMAAYTHAQLANYPHGRMLAGSLAIIDPVGISSSSAGSERKFVKFLKSLRFRHIYYEVRFETDGSILTAPAKLFTLLTPVASKQVVSKKIS